MRVVTIALIGTLMAVDGSWAQVTPAAGYTPPDDTPAIRLGMTLFPTYTFQTEPDITDAAGNSVNRNAFDVARAYINVTGQISHLVAFRITPDIARESTLLGLLPGNTVPNDSLVFRIKYAYGQFNLDDWLPRGSWVRLGIQQTPWVDFEEGIYRYRFQGTVFAERIPLPTTMTSADAGVSFHTNIASNYGEVHFGLYNGENYQRVEINQQKGFEYIPTPGMRFNMVPWMTWSPQGDRVAYASNREGVMDLFDQAVGAPEPERLLLKSGERKLPTSWSADGKLLLFQQETAGNGWDLWALSLDGERHAFPLLQSRFNETQGYLSPDGRWLAYTSDETGEPQVYLRPFARKVTGANEPVVVVDQVAVAMVLGRVAAGQHAEQQPLAA